VSADALKLTVYFGERARAGEHALSDALLERFGAAGLAGSVLLRGLSGYGPKHGLRTDQLLTLSEDLPLVAVAVDERARIEALAGEVEALAGDGLVTLEGARLVRGADDDPPALGGPTKLSVYVGRRERVGERSAARAVVDVLHRHGMAGASVLLGVDGTTHGERHRAALLGRNADVPLLIVSVGEAAAARAAVAELVGLLARPLITVEPVTVLKRDGRALAPAPVADGGADADAGAAKLTVYASQVSRADDLPLHTALLTRLRRANAPGATVLRGVWGYHGDHEPHGDRLLALRRRVPVVATLVVEPDRSAEAWRIVDELTTRTGLVTWARVPRVRSAGGEP
jgi:PII-like signaling protein